MTARATTAGAVRFGLNLTRETALLATIVLAAGVGAVALALLGYAALLVPFYLTLVVVVVARPRHGSYIVMALGLAFEPAAIDSSKPISVALYELPPALKDLLPITVSPLELLMAFTALVVFFRLEPASQRAPLPRIVFAIPVFVALGFVYGLQKGGDVKLGYQEARGLMFGAFAFVTARRLTGGHERPLIVAGLGGIGVLSLIVLGRYFFITRSGTAGIPLEMAYAHEDAMFLAIGFVAALVLLLRQGRGRDRLLLVVFEALVLAALLTTGRRAGTLVLVIGVATAVLFCFRHRPALVVAMGVPAVLISAAYLGAYWNKEYGAIAQPARAIRSQIDPSARDDSSDTYRETERYDVTQTVRLNRVMGVGFGRPFAPFQPLPDLTSFWPLQFFTPHSNLLWLWLKMGALGAGALLATWVLAFGRCVSAFREAISSNQFDSMPVIAASILLMYLSYAQVDLALVGARSAAVLACALAAALSLPRGGLRDG